VRSALRIARVDALQVCLIRKGVLFIRDCNSECVTQRVQQPKPFSTPTCLPNHSQENISFAKAAEATSRHRGRCLRGPDCDWRVFKIFKFPITRNTSK